MMIIACNCKHESHDRLYGKGRRLHNKTKKGGTGPTLYRCTVCVKLRTADGKERDGKER